MRQNNTQKEAVWCANKLLLNMIIDAHDDIWCRRMWWNDESISASKRTHPIGNDFLCQSLCHQRHALHRGGPPCNNAQSLLFVHQEDFDMRVRGMIQEFLRTLVKQLATTRFAACWWLASTRTSRNTMPRIFGVFYVFLGAYRVLSYFYTFVLCIFSSIVQGVVKSL